MAWQLGKSRECKTKYTLAIEMLDWALQIGFPKCTVLADSWFGIGPFIKELSRLGLSYVVEIKKSYNVKTPCKELKLTPTGKKAKNQLDLIGLPQYFKDISSVAKCGFCADSQSGKKEKVLYHTGVNRA